MRIAKRPTLFFRFFGVGFAHTFHKFYNLPSNTLISFNFFCHSTLRPPFTPIQYARGAFVTYGDSGVALLPVGNTGSGLRLLPYGQYAYAAALCRIAQYAPLARLCAHCVARIRRAYFAPWAQYAYAATAIALRAIRLRGGAISHPLNTRRLRGYVLTALRAYAAPFGYADPNPSGELAFQSRRDPKPF